MDDFCQNPYCEDPSAKEVPVSVSTPSDQVRALCMACEEAYSWGAQQGKAVAQGFVGSGPASTTVISDEADTSYSLDAFLEDGSFMVVGKNREDPNPDVPFEAWAYNGPLDFDSAVPVTFGLGASVSEAIGALTIHLAASPRQDGHSPPTEHRDAWAPSALLVSDRELATILAALRFHQDENLQADCIPDAAIEAIASDGGLLRPLNSVEVETLCERINRSNGASDAALKQQAVHPAVQRIHDLLYLDMTGGREFYSPDKICDAHTTAMIAQVVAEYIPRPE